MLWLSCCMAYVMHLSCICHAYLHTLASFMTLIWESQITISNANKLGMRAKVFAAAVTDTTSQSSCLVPIAWRISLAFSVPRIHWQCIKIHPSDKHRITKASVWSRVDECPSLSLLVPRTPSMRKSSVFFIPAPTDFASRLQQLIHHSPEWPMKAHWVPNWQQAKTLPHQFLLFSRPCLWAQRLKWLHWWDKVTTVSIQSATRHRNLPFCHSVKWLHWLQWCLSAFDLKDLNGCSGGTELQQQALRAPQGIAICQGLCFRGAHSMGRFPEQCLFSCEPFLFFCMIIAAL